MRVSDQQRYQSFAMHVETRLSNFVRIEKELAEGKRIFKPSEDVTMARRSMTAQGALSENKQYMRNIEDGRNLAASASARLQNVVDLLNEIDALAIAADNSHMTAEDRRNTAVQINQKIESMIEAVNASHAGRYLFGGHQTTAAPFTVMRNDEGNIIGINANEDTIGGKIYRRIDRGEDLHVNIPGDRLFQPVGEAGTEQDMIHVLAAMRDVISNNNTPPEGEEDTLSTEVLRENLNQLRERVITEQTYLGSVTQRLDEKTDYFREREIILTEELEEAEGVDMAELVSRLAIEENIYNSLLAINSRILSRSLVDYLG